MCAIILGKPLGIGYGIVAFRQRLPSGGLVSTNKAMTKMMFSDAEIMAFVLIGLLWLPIIYFGCLIFISKTDKKR